MGEYFSKIYSLIKNKKLITLFTTLVNINCLAYYVFSHVIFKSDTATTSIFTNKHFIAIIILAIINLWICCGFIHLCIKPNFYNECQRTEETQSALEAAKFLAELHRGNIVSSKIYSFDHVAQIERESVKGDEIWCITGDLEEDSKNTDLGSIISNNLRNGVVYRYFITRVGDIISNKASWGEKTLREANLAYKNRLIFIKADEELIAPDIDIIIYKANHVNERIGFVCVEIGDDQNTYVYQKINKITLQGICDKLMAYDIVENRPNFFAKLFSKIHKAMHFFVEHLSIIYLVFSTGGLALLSFTKIVSLTTAIMFLLPAILESFITIALMIGITDFVFAYKKIVMETSKNEDILASIINSQEIKSVTEDLKKKTLDKLMHQKGLGHANKVLQIDENCSTIWILSNLSHDIANQDFYNCLISNLELYPNLKCYVLYTNGTAALGRTSKLKNLKNKYQDRIKTYPIANISPHYIWSETYGIIFLENINKQHDVYVSLGCGNDAFYKNVITTEEEVATLLGRLTNIAGIEL